MSTQTPWANSVAVPPLQRRMENDLQKTYVQILADETRRQLGRNPIGFSDADVKQIAERVDRRIKELIEAKEVIERARQMGIVI